MLHQISWFTYAVTIFLLITVYYLYISLTFYGYEIRAVFYQLTGKQPALKTPGNGDIDLSGYSIMGKAQSGDVEFVSQDELSFGPPEIPDEAQIAEPTATPPAETGGRLAEAFSGMVLEVEMLIRVINETSECKENFEMLFRLLLQKYPPLAGTVYQEQINDFLLTEGAPQFPFPLTIDELENYWLNEN